MKDGTSQTYTADMVETKNARSFRQQAPEKYALAVLIVHIWEERYC
jgi:hypothetical protein